MLLEVRNKSVHILYELIPLFQAISRPLWSPTMGVRMSVQTLSATVSADSREFDPSRPFVVVNQAAGLISTAPKEPARWVESAIVRLYDMIEAGFFQTVAVDVAITLPVTYKDICEALYREHWINLAGKLVVHGAHSPCGDLQQYIILPNGHETSWLPTIEIVSMGYTDSLAGYDLGDCHDCRAAYDKACQTAFTNLRQGRRHIEPFVLG